MKFFPSLGNKICQKWGGKFQPKLRYILFFVVHFSKFNKAYLLKNKSSNELLKFIKIFIPEVGMPQIFQSDQGDEFKSKKIKEFFKRKYIIY